MRTGVCSGTVWNRGRKVQPYEVTVAQVGVARWGAPVNVNPVAVNSPVNRAREMAWCLLSN